MNNFQDFLDNSLEYLKGIYKKVEEVPELKTDEINYKDTMLVIIDINNGFARKGALYSDRVEALINPISELIKKFNDNGGKVMAFTDAHPKDAIEFESYPPHCVDTEWESELVDELKSFNIEIVKKNSTNGFIEENYKVPKEIKNLIVVGDCTDICIYQFAISQKTYFNMKNEARNVIVPKNLVDTFDAPYHNGDFNNLVFLNSMIDNGIKVVDLKL